MDLPALVKGRNLVVGANASNAIRSSQALQDVRHSIDIPSSLSLSHSHPPIHKQVFANKS